MNAIGHQQQESPLIGNPRFLKRGGGVKKEVTLAVSQWRSVASKFGLIKREIDRIASAFEDEELKKTKRFLL